MGVGTAMKGAYQTYKASRAGGGAISKSISGAVDAGAKSLSRKHNYSGNLGGMLKTNRGRVTGVSNYGKIVGASGTAGAVGLGIG